MLVGTGLLEEVPVRQGPCGLREVGHGAEERPRLLLCQSPEEKPHVVPLHRLGAPVGRRTAVGN